MKVPVGLVVSCMLSVSLDLGILRIPFPFAFAFLFGFCAFVFLVFFLSLMVSGVPQAQGVPAQIPCRLVQG